MVLSASECEEVKRKREQGKNAANEQHETVASRSQHDIGDVPPRTKLRGRSDKGVGEQRLVGMGGVSAGWRRRESKGGGGGRERESNE